MPGHTVLGDNTSQFIRFWNVLHLQRLLRASQARRKQLQIVGGGGAHIISFKMTDLCNKKKNIFFFFFLGGGGAYLCELLGGGGARPPPLFLRP